MQKTLFITFFTLTLLLLPLYSTTAAPTSEKNTITITLTDNGLLVEEIIRLNNTTPSNITMLTFWIQQDATKIQLIATDQGIALNPNPVTSSHLREYNLSNQNQNIQSKTTKELILTYTLPTNTEHFEKQLQYDTTYLTVTFNDNELYQLQDTTKNTHLRLVLFRPSETPLNLIYIIIIFLLVVLIVALTLLLFRKRQTKARQKISDSEESLTIKKQLLLNSLKDIEKKHRAKEISDATYSKLKNDYKQEAVTVMKKLEEVQKK